MTPGRMVVGAAPQSSRWAVWTTVALAVAIVAGGFTAILFVAYPRCACPGATPLGTALKIGNGTGACAAGNGTSPSECAYSFFVEVDPFGQGSAAIPSARDLTFTLQSSSGVTITSSFVVTLISLAGSRLGVWSSANASWTTLAQGSVCGGGDCLSGALSSGELLTLQALPNGGLPYSHQGDELISEALGGGFSGWVAAPID